MSPAQLAAWVARSRTAQGLPVKVTDPAVVRQVAVLISGRSGSGAGRDGGGPDDHSELRTQLAGDEWAS